MGMQMSPQNPTFESKAEEIFFKALKDFNGLNDWHAMYDVRIQKHKHKRIGQTDFILIGPLGVFIIEVKGGSHHEWDPNKPLYSWGDPNHPDEYMTSKESPLEQAAGNAQSLLNFLYENLNKDILHPGKINIGHAAAFPEAQIKESSDLEWDPKQIYDLSNDNFAIFLKKLSEFSSGGRNQKLSPKEISHIKVAIRQKKVSVKKLNSNAGNDDLLIIEGDLRESIQEIDWSLNNRLLYRGGAGTGKTVMATFIAERFSLQPEKKILWISFNKEFTESVKENLKEFGNIEVTTTYSLYARTMKRFGYNFSLNNDNNDEAFAECVCEAVSNNEYDQYDAVILDEGQDVITDSFLVALDSMLKNGLKKGSWFIFLDDEFQAEVFNRLDHDRLEELQSYANNVKTLSINRRNPTKVIETTEQYLDIEINKKRKFLGEVDFIDNSTSSRMSGQEINDLRFKLYDEIISLFNQKREDIVILCDESDNKISQWVNNEYLMEKSKKKCNRTLHLFNKSISKLPEKFKAVEIPCMNISRFKGLEAKTVVICWKKSNWEKRSRKGMFYTAITRSTESITLILEDDF